MGGPGQRPSQLGPNGVAIEAGELLDVLEHPDTLQNEDASDALTEPRHPLTSEEQALPLLMATHTLGYAPEDPIGLVESCYRAIEWILTTPIAKGVLIPRPLPLDGNP